jgi:hypothetical protein
LICQRNPALSPPLTSGKPVTGNGPGGGGLENFKTDLFTGAASFSYPIQAPPGTHGLQPSVSLAYSSAKGNSWVGFGWSLDLGSIRRDTRQGTPSYVDSPETDHFVFGDDKLIKIRDNTSPSLREYSTLNESFVRVRRYDIGTANDRRTVETKDGMTLYFGTTGAGRVTQPSPDTGIYAWFLDRVEDRFGNFYTAQYNAAGDTGVLYPKTILYTFHTTTPGGAADDDMTQRRRIDFCLEGDTECDHVSPFTMRPDPVLNYLPGFKTETTHRLGRIRVAMADASGNVTADSNGITPTGVKYIIPHSWEKSQKVGACSTTPSPATKSLAVGRREFVERMEDELAGASPLSAGGGHRRQGSRSSRAESVLWGPFRPRN